MSGGQPEAHVVILAGGRGTRFWPRSRTRTPKQLLNIVGRETMLEQTFARLAPLIPPSHMWVVTNTEQAASVRRQLPRVPASQILAEPVGRNTAAAIGLAAAGVAVGDAAHACPPTIAQGGAQALEDAAVLTELLLGRPAVDDALWAAFTARRFDRASTVVGASCQLGQWQLDHEQGDVPGLLATITALVSQPA